MRCLWCTWGLEKPQNSALGIPTPPQFQLPLKHGAVWKPLPWKTGIWDRYKCQPIPGRGAGPSCMTQSCLQQTDQFRPQAPGRQNTLTCTCTCLALGGHWRTPLHKLSNPRMSRNHCKHRVMAFTVNPISLLGNGVAKITLPLVKPVQCVPVGLDRANLANMHIC